MNMKRNLSTVIAAFLAFVFLSPCLYGKSNGSLTLDGVYSRYNTDNFKHKNGAGGSLLLEFQPVEFFSIGAGLDTLCYFGTDTPGQTILESVNLVTRLIFNTGDPFRLYLIGGGGINPKLDLKTDLQWGGDYHLMGGLGTWLFLSPKVAFDLAAVYDYHHQSLLPPTDSMRAVNIRIGFCFFFEDVQKNASAKTSETPTPVTQVVSEASLTPTVEPAAPVTTAEAEVPAATPTAETVTPVPTTEEAAPSAATTEAPAATLEATTAPTEEVATPVPTEKPETPVPTQAIAESVKPAVEKEETTILPGDSLWDTAARPEVYGDPELYPLLVDANRKTLASGQYVLKPGTKLVVPKDPTQDMINQARKNAWTQEYQRFGGRRLTPNGYQRWRLNHGLPNDYHEMQK
jgi:hypothetical protein